MRAMRVAGLLAMVGLGGCAASHGEADAGGYDGGAVVVDGGLDGAVDAGVGEVDGSMADSGANSCPSHGVSALRLWSDSPAPGCPDGLGWWLDPASTSIVPLRCEAIEEACADAAWVCDGPSTAPPESTAEMRLSLDGVAELRMFDVDGVEYCHGFYDLTVERGGSGAFAGGSWWSGPIGPGT